MKPSLSDPNNQVSEVSPDDGRGAPEKVVHEPVSGGIVLPTRRTLTGKMPSASLSEVGSLSRANSLRLEPKDTAQRLEVQGSTGDVIRLDPRSEPPPKIERQFNSHEGPLQENPKKIPKRLISNLKRIHLGGSRWILAMGLVVMVVVVSGLIMLPAINAPNAPRANSGGMVLRVVEEKEIEGLEPLTALLDRKPEARGIFHSYARATGVDEITPLVRNDPGLLATLRSHWKPLGCPKSWTPGADSSWDVLDLGDRAYGLLSVELPDGSRFAAYFTNEDGRLLLDWKATVGFGTASFTELGNGVGDGSEIRGELASAHYYNATCPETDYQCYKLTSPDKATTIWCYTRRGDKADDTLGLLFNQGIITGESKIVQKATLRLSRSLEGSMPNQWLIQELLHIDWATP